MIQTKCKRFTPTTVTEMEKFVSDTSNRIRVVAYNPNGQRYDHIEAVMEFDPEVLTKDKKFPADLRRRIVEYFERNLDVTIQELLEYEP